MPFVHFFLAFHLTITYNVPMNVWAHLLSELKITLARTPFRDWPALILVWLQLRHLTACLDDLFTAWRAGTLPPQPAATDAASARPTPSAQPQKSRAASPRPHPVRLRRMPHPIAPAAKPGARARASRAPRAWRTPRPLTLEPHCATASPHLRLEVPDIPYRAPSKILGNLTKRF